MYIRTENGIYELKDNMSIENAVYYLFGKFEKTNKKHLFRNDKDLGEVVKQADTIEQLCDEFVIVRNGERPTILLNYDNLSLLKARVVKDNQKVYGAIWTDIGLKYIAKMNGEGELELI